MPETTNAPPAPPRQRATKACVACSIRKIKCDGNEPCGRCIRFFNGECSYTAAQKRGPPKGCPARGGHRKRVAVESGDVKSKSPVHSPGTTTREAMGPAGASANAMAMGMGAPSPMHTDTKVPVSPGGALPPGLDPQLFAGLDVRSIDVGTRAHTGLYIPPPSTAASPVSPHSQSLSQGTFAYQAGLTSAAIDDLLLVYETFIHPHWPVIYLPALKSFRSLEIQSPLVFDAVLAISATNSDAAHDQDHLLPTEKVSPRPLWAVCDMLTQSVRQRVMSAVSAPDTPPSLQVVQALHMVALIDIGGGRPSLAFQMGGFACRMALDLGLHTNSSLDPNAGATSAHALRYEQECCRTLWACFILDKILAAVLQRPPLLRLIDIDAPRPSIMERDELDLWLAGRAQALLHPDARESMECRKAHTLSAFNSWIDICAILEHILDQVYRPSIRRARMDGQHVEGYDDAVRYIDAELTKWRTSLPPHLQWFDDDPKAHEHLGQHFLTIRGWYYVSMLLLHRPQVPYLDRADSPDATDTAYAASDHDRPSDRFPSGAEAARHAATAICTIVESYERTFRVRKFSSSWVYILFQAGTVHSGLAAHVPGPFPAHLSPTRTELLRRLEQCIRWLEVIALQWHSAGRHVEILRRLSALSARTKPPSPILQASQADYLTMSLPTATSVEQDSGAASGSGSASDLPPLDLNAWMLLWASMPAAGDDISLWQQCFPHLP